MTGVTFDGLALVNPEPVKEVDEGVKVDEVRLFSGKTYLHVSGETRFKTSFKGATANMADIDALKAKVGDKYTLTIGGTSYAKCAISRFRWGWLTPTGSHYWYEVEFTQETA